MSSTLAIKTILRREIMRILQEDLTFSVLGEDSGKPISPKNVIFQKTRVQRSRSHEKANQLLDLPALVISSAIASTTLETGGTNNNDLWVYRWLVQLLDKDFWSQENRIATWEKWGEQIVSYFMFAGMNGVVTLPQGEIWWSNATEVEGVDEKSWIAESDFIKGWEITVKVLQPRGII